MAKLAREDLLNALACMMFLLIAVTTLSRISPIPHDFRAFYCAGAAMRIGADPYLVEPLRVCELTGDVNRPPLKQGAVIPAPLPGYDLAFFKSIAGLPYAVAIIIWQMLLWIATAVTIFALQKITGLKAYIVITPFLLSDGFVGMAGENLAGIACAGIALAAWALSQRRYLLAATSATLAMCEPHIGLSAYLALFLFSPSTRWMLFLYGCLLGVLSGATLGFAETREYFLDVLPRQRDAEIAHRVQYSLTHLLHLMHVPDAAAVALGEYSYAAMFIIGIITAVRLRRALHSDAFLPTIPPAFTLIGGIYLHLAQIPIALPAALLLYAKAPRIRKTLAWGILLLGIPWTNFYSLCVILPITAPAIALLAYALFENQRTAGIIMLGSSAFFLTLVRLTAMEPSLSPLTLNLPPTSFSNDLWKTHVIAQFSQHAYIYLIAIIPTWFGLSIVAWAAIQTALSPARLSSNRLESSIP